MTEPELTREIRDQRIAICQDVLERLQLRALHLKRNHTYCASTTLKEHYNIAEFRGIDAQECVDDLESECQICADGALLLSTLRLYNGMPMDDMLNVSGHVHVSSTLLESRLGPIFGLRMLRAFEAVFEHVMPSTTGFSAPERWALKQFGHFFAAPEAALEVMCRHVIEHDGDLVIADLKVPAAT